MDFGGVIPAYDRLVAGMLLFGFLENVSNKS
jgi:hypothetical protein